MRQTVLYSLGCRKGLTILDQTAPFFQGCQWKTIFYSFCGQPAFHGFWLLSLFKGNNGFVLL